MLCNAVNNPPLSPLEGKGRNKKEDKSKKKKENDTYPAV